MKKFDAYTALMPCAIGNPIYHWSHLELQRYFNVREALCPENADSIWNKTMKCLGKNGIRCRDFLERSNVEVICTSDDPISSLHSHRQIEQLSLSCRVYPTWRPDQALDLTVGTYAEYCRLLGESAGISIHSYSDFKAAILKRLDFFSAHGCVMSDHSVFPEYICQLHKDAVESTFQKALCNDVLLPNEINGFLTDLLVFLNREYDKRNWIVQYHIGAIRNTSTRNFSDIGLIAVLIPPMIPISLLPSLCCSICLIKQTNCREPFYMCSTPRIIIPF